jgi:hypothetical protein
VLVQVFALRLEHHSCSNVGALLCSPYFVAVKTDGNINESRRERICMNSKTEKTIEPVQTKFITRKDIAQSKNAVTF